MDCPGFVYVRLVSIKVIVCECFRVGCTIDDVRRDREHLRTYPYPSQLVYWQSVSHCGPVELIWKRKLRALPGCIPCEKIDTETFCGSFDLVIAALTESIAEAGAMSLPAVVSELPPVMSEWGFPRSNDPHVENARTFVRLCVERAPAGVLSLEDLVRESYYKNLRGDSHVYREEAARALRETLEGADILCADDHFFGVSFVEHIHFPTVPGPSPRTAARRPARQALVGASSAHR
jgi:hypothetical protein